ncbi:MAG: TerB family tellurite resistance protein, partial [Campylobacterales bacterium]|nr:TerB family tellurite resistance protein [Campylobacterales bacterium]
FNQYQSDNPYHAPNADYNHSFQGNKKGDIYEEVLQSEFGLIVALTAKVAKADGAVCELEGELIHNMFDELSGYFSNKEKAREILEKILIEEEHENDNIEMIAGEFLKYTNSDKKKRVKVVEHLINLAFIDKHLSENEEDIIRKIAFYLQISSGELEATLNRFKSYYKDYKTSDKNPYEVLGVDENITPTELKKKYRQLVKENHPDIVCGKGLGEEYVEKATVRLQEINEAYEKIKG